MTVARAIATSKIVALSGLECYEGLQVNGDSARDTAMVGALMQRVKNVALACDAEKLFAGTSIILTAGGSAAFDIVARELPLRLSQTGADDSAQRLLRHARFGLLQSHARAGQGAQRRRVANACRAAARARSVVARAILPRAGARHSHHGQARRVVRPRPAGAHKALPHRSRRRAATRAGVVENYRR